jgi:TrmH family RNA methyltransferase
MQFRAALSGERRGHGLVAVEGLRLVEAALGSRLQVEAILVSDLGKRHMARIAPLIERGTQILRTSDRLFKGITDTQAPQGIAVLVQPRKTTFENIMCKSALVVVLAGVQDPGNVGTIIRAAEAFGATGAATCSADDVGTADPLGPKALRASAGSALRLPVLHGVPVADLLSKLQVAGMKVYAAVADAMGGREKSLRSTSPWLRPWEADWRTPAAILIGNEGAGLPEEIVRDADARVCIPQTPATTPVGVESLNAAMAATVLLYEAMRQRNSLR